MEMRKQFWLAAAVMLAIVVSSLPAEFVPLTDMVPLGQVRERFAFGDQVFTNFQLNPGIAVGPAAFTPNYDSLRVQGGYDRATGNIGLHFVTALVAGSNSIADLNFSFQVETIADRNQIRHQIKDVGFVMTGASAINGAVMTASETVWSQGQLLASLGLGLQGNGSAPVLNAQREFSPVYAITVYKDILVMGGANPAGITHVSEFYQYFSHVPEPVSLSLLGLGGLAMLRRRK